MKGFEIKFLSYYFETKLSDTAATCFSSSQFAKKLTLRMKIKLKDSSPLAKLPIAKRKDERGKNVIQPSRLQSYKDSAGVLMKFRYWSLRVQKSILLIV